MAYEVVPVLLNQDDLNSMCFSIENRSPYLGKKLYVFMSNVKVICRLKMVARNIFL